MTWLRRLLARRFYRLAEIADPSSDVTFYVEPGANDARDLTVQCGEFMLTAELSNDERFALGTALTRSKADMAEIDDFDDPL